MAAFVGGCAMELGAVCRPEEMRGAAAVMVDAEAASGEFAANAEVVSGESAANAEAARCDAVRLASAEAPAAWLEDHGGPTWWRRGRGGSARRWPGAAAHETAGYYRGSERWLVLEEHGDVLA